MALPHSRNPLVYPPRFQFGEAGAPCGGSSCCTEAVLKMIIEYYKERTYTLSSIRYWAQARTSYTEASCTGINYIEALNALKHYGVSNYRYKAGATLSDISHYLNYGPVAVGVWYGTYPKSRGGRCGTINRALRNGKTDCGFRGSHMILVAKRGIVVDSRGRYIRSNFYTRDPDHHSASRPEMPDYDIITDQQLNRTMADLPKYSRFRNTYILYPVSKKSL